MEKKPLGVKIVGGLSVFFGVLLLINLIFQWENLARQYTYAIIFVDLLYGASLTASGVGILKLKNWGRGLLIGICAVNLLCVLIALMVSSFHAGGVTAASLLVLAFPLVFFVSPLAYLLMPKVKEYFNS